MSCTENEAITKWCPEVKILLAPPQYEGGSAYIITNRYGGSDYNCMGATCMHWRWSEDDTRKGYCGKAGKG